MKNSRKSVQGITYAKPRGKRGEPGKAPWKRRYPPWSLNGRPGERAFQIEGLKWARARVCEMPQVCEHVCVAGQEQKGPAVWDWQASGEGRSHGRSGMPRLNSTQRPGSLLQKFKQQGTIDRCVFPKGSSD